MKQTPKQRRDAVLNHIKSHGGKIVVNQHGVYSLSGGRSLFADTTSTETRNAFLAKYCVPFTAGQARLHRIQRLRNLARYTRLAHRALDCAKFETAMKLAESASFLKDNLTPDAYHWERFYTLKSAN
jgi:hypothetical protein